MRNHPEGEIDEMIEIYVQRGMSKADATTVISTMSKYHDFFVDARGRRGTLSGGVAVASLWRRGGVAVASRWRRGGVAVASRRGCFGVSEGSSSRTEPRQDRRTRR